MGRVPSSFRDDLMGRVPEEIPGGAGFLPTLPYGTSNDSFGPFQ